MGRGMIFSQGNPRQDPNHREKDGVFRNICLIFWSLKFLNLLPTYLFYLKDIFEYITYLPAYLPTLYLHTKYYLLFSSGGGESDQSGFNSSTSNSGELNVLRELKVCEIF
uniref:Uncharacterized protein n=1 Tax=Cacopsylla melanoneura TaxID=428564 RepID=A0A8D8T5X3_9HEMI